MNRRKSRRRKQEKGKQERKQTDHGLFKDRERLNRAIHVGGIARIVRIRAAVGII